MKKKNLLPWICPDHPEALIKHTWDETHFVWKDDFPRGEGIKKNHKYECNICGRELKPPEV